MARPLSELFFQQKSKVVDKWEQYLGIYDLELGGLLKREEPIRLLEIGDQNGGSLELWQKYLPEGSVIRGVDINEKCGQLAFASDFIRVDVLDAATSEITELLGDEFFDVIIDDGSHRSQDIIASFKILFNHLAPGGKYFVEDLHCSYYPSHSGGFREQGASIEWLKCLIDALHLDYIEPNSVKDITDFSLLKDYNPKISRITFYDSMAVIEKLKTEKTAPYRRLCSGQDATAFPFFDVLSEVPLQTLAPIVFASPTAKQIDYTLLRSREDIKAKLQASESSLAKMHADAAAVTESRAQLSASNASLMQTVNEQNERFQDLQKRTVDLRDEVTTLRESLNEQVARFREPANRARQQRIRATALTAKCASLERVISRQFTQSSKSEASEPNRLRRAIRSAASRTRRRLRPKSTQITSTMQCESGLSDGQLVYSAIKESTLFDQEFYATQNPDVQVADVDLISHYIDFGASEKRDPHPDFSTAYYLAENPDVSDAGTNPLYHYLDIGALENRDTFPVDEGMSSLGEPEIDLIVECLIKNSGLFDPVWYCNAYKDVADQGLDAFRHFIRYGLREGRDPNEIFSSDWYKLTYPDVAAAGELPLLHYLQMGVVEERQVSDRFNSLWYSNSYGEMMGVAELPLSHFLRVGRHNGLLPLDPNAAYATQVLNEKQQSAFERNEIRHHIDCMIFRPLFIVFVEGHNEEGSERTVISIKGQIYPNYSIQLGGLEDVVTNLERLGTDITFLVWLQSGDELNERALYEFAGAVNSDPSVEMIYCDEDDVATGNRLNPFYKPGWSPDYLESFNYINSAACFKIFGSLRLLRECVSRYDFLLRFTETHLNVVHLRKILCHSSRPACRNISENQAQLDISSLTGRLDRTGRVGVVAQAKPGLNGYAVRLHLKMKPLISIVIPTAGKTVEIRGSQVDLIISCVDLINSRSTYKNIEVIVVDNADLPRWKREALRRRRCKLVSYDNPVFNVAKKLNLGVSEATGEFLVLLNDDIEPIVGDWLERMLDHFEKPHVGVVGGKLLYADGSLQHVGVVTNCGNPDHVRRGRPGDESGYFLSTCVSRNYLAVTGACMMTRTDVYRDVGGYTEELAVSFNDVDYCLKLISKGLTVVYAPEAELFHFESQSREAFLDRRELAYFSNRWASTLTSDPFYNEDCLNIAPPSFDVVQRRKLI